MRDGLERALLVEREAMSKAHETTLKLALARRVWGAQLAFFRSSAAESSACSSACAARLSSERRALHALGCALYCAAPKLSRPSSRVSERSQLYVRATRTVQSRTPTPSR